MGKNNRTNPAIHLATWVCIAVFATTFFAVSCQEHDMYYIPGISNRVYDVQEPGIAVPGSNIDEKFIWLQTNAQSGENYDIEFDADRDMVSKTLSSASLNNTSDISIHLKGKGGRRTIKLTSIGSPLFTVEGSVTLVLDDNITLQGISGTVNNSAPLVSVNNPNGKLIMNPGSIITGNTSHTETGMGAGVYVQSGEFIMTGGTISYNTASSGQGISAGGGVYVQSGVFTMTGGTISNNTGHFGGGVNVEANGTFNMTGGIISDNTADSSNGTGGGVNVRANGTFTKTGGTISNNKASIGNTAYVESSDSEPKKQRDSAAGSNVNMRSDTAGPNGGWE